MTFKVKTGSRRTKFRWVDCWRNGRKRVDMVLRPDRPGMVKVIKHFRAFDLAQTFSTENYHFSSRNLTSTEIHVGNKLNALKRKCLGHFHSFHLFALTFTNAAGTGSNLVSSWFVPMKTRTKILKDLFVWSIQPRFNPHLEEIQLSNPSGSI